MRVFRRGQQEAQPELVYETGSKSYPNATEAIIQERAKNGAQILSNPEKFRQRIESLKARVAQSKNTENAQILMGKIEQLQQEFEQELEKYKAQEK